MKCDRQLLNLYLDNELDEEQKKVVEGHLKECKSCRDELNELKMVDGWVRATEVEPPTREFFFRLNRQVMKKIKKRPGFHLPRLIPILTPVAVAALVFIVLVNVNQQKRLAGIDDRIFYAYAEPMAEKEITKKKEIQSVAKPAAGLGQEVGGDKAKAFESVSLEGLEIPKDRVVRAIIDSTGRVLNVATGNTIIPQRDTMLENRLQGKKFLTPMVGKRKMQQYVDLTQKKSDNH